MPAQWTADLIGKMHTYRIKQIELARKMKWTPEYTSMVLNGHREPAGAETAMRAALEEIIKNRKDLK